MLSIKIQSKLAILSERHQELIMRLGDAAVIADQKLFKQLSCEYSSLNDIVDSYHKYLNLVDKLEQAKALLTDTDSDIQELAEQDIENISSLLASTEQNLQMQLLPKDPDDSCDVFLEIRAGTGGDEAAIFVGDLARMYIRFAEQKKWQIETICARESEQGGYKELILRLAGQEVYSYLKFESGAHRVQRVPATESQGRLHTSACTVAVMPQVDEIESVNIDPKDLRIDKYRASGAGGQHVNRTDSAVRVTHLPTGIVAECQEDRSQHKNLAKAMSLLNSRILNSEKTKQQQEQAQARKQLVGSGDRSERIRTYNYPQGRVTDHRIQLTLYKLPEIIDGQLDPLLIPLRQAHQLEQLANLNEDE